MEKYLLVIALIVMFCFGMATDRGCSKNQYNKQPKSDTVLQHDTTNLAGVHDTIKIKAWFPETTYVDSGKYKVPEYLVCDSADTITPHGTKVVLKECFYEKPKIQFTIFDIQEPPIVHDTKVITVIQFQYINKPINWPLSIATHLVAAGLGFYADSKLRR